MQKISDLAPPISEKTRFFKTPDLPIIWVPQLQTGATPTRFIKIKKFFRQFTNPDGYFKMGNKKIFDYQTHFRALTGL